MNVDCGVSVARFLELTESNKCKGCQYRTPKSKGGKGRLCDGYTMRKYNRCPEWAIEERRRTK